MTAAPEAVRLDGKVVSAAAVADLQAAVAGLAYRPQLVFVRVGEDPASAYYVRSKEKLAAKVGVRSRTVVLPEGTGAEALLALVAELNADDDVDGILVQLPVPGVDPTRVLAAIDPAKDVDGLNPVNVGRLWSGGDALVPATPLGVLALLDHYAVPLAGKRAVVVGRSNLVGKPLAALLLQRDATVTIAHSRTRDLGALTREADVLVAAVGRPRLITPDMVKPGSAVLDVGLTREDGAIVGDVHPGVAGVAGYLTPMPGGTGLMTVVMVIANTLTAARRRRGA
ncbi:MAG: bifunctional 5,10-methylene-tetrahydrofolate dehydrogenase/5,10-methylene-tetrahydrofolate cyclohydrolase [Trueperaceae bacterium]|nr:bifunctional 5,10-methylene-tetrahydrofolate dehydrogenase/5,10-methylene-tetrahydrofolate cyclohydrolase [Trueperaceae bacterium]MCW5820729.1 bifunctional 5,10-methylene-tetrahydrofolate dehydrogenase/5,10-methylene-tetrahydrofolate cyclohydrolase [Trueperaceae bacterium]